MIPDYPVSEPLNDPWADAEAYIDDTPRSIVEHNAATRQARGYRWLTHMRAQLSTGAPPLTALPDETSVETGDVA